MLLTGNIIDMIVVFLIVTMYNEIMFGAINFIVVFGYMNKEVKSEYIIKEGKN